MREQIGLRYPTTRRGEVTMPVMYVNSGHPSSSSASPGTKHMEAFPHPPTSTCGGTVRGGQHSSGVRRRHRRVHRDGSGLPDATSTYQDLTRPGGAGHRSRVSRRGTVIPSRKVRLTAPAERRPIRFEFNGRTPRSGWSAASILFCNTSAWSAHIGVSGPQIRCLAINGACCGLRNSITADQ